MTKPTSDLNLLFVVKLVDDCSHLDTVLDAITTALIFDQSIAVLMFPPENSDEDKEKCFHLALQNLCSQLQPFAIYMLNKNSPDDRPLTAESNDSLIFLSPKSTRSLLTESKQCLYF